MREKIVPPIPVQQPQRRGMKLAELSCGQAFERIRTGCLPVEQESFGTGRHRVILLPDATDELKSLVHYGRPHAASLMEQQFQGMGHAFQKDGSLTVVISHVLHQYSASRAPGHVAAVERPEDIAMAKCLAMERELYQKYERRCNCVDGKQRDPFLDCGSSKLILFGHTHPDLGAFFSTEDHDVHRATENFPAVSLVCDPIRREWKAMVGVDHEPAVVTLFSYASDRDVAEEYEEQVGWLRRLARAFADGIHEEGVRGRYRVRCGRDRKLRVRLRMTVDPPRADEEEQGAQPCP